MRVWRILAASCAVVGLCAPTVASRADDANAECTNNNDITIVVDFQELGGGVNVRCAPQPVKNGFDAFHRTNIAVDDYRGFVCRIAGVPEEGPCDRYPPSNYYWVYWLAPRGGEWCYSQVGAGSRTPPPGSIEGWSFFKKSSSRPHSTPPRYPVPAAIAGTTPNKLDGGDCATSTNPTTSTTAAPSPSPSPSPSPTNPSPAPNDPSPAPTAATPSGSGGQSATGRNSTTTVAAIPGATVTTAFDLAAPTPVSSTTSSIPLGNVDLTIRRHASKGSPLGFILGVGFVGALGVTAFVLRRMR